MELARWGYDGPLTIRTARLQAASHQPAQHSLVDRAARLLSECATAWCRDLGVDAALAYEWGWSRGLVGSVTLTAAQFFGGPCERCDETGCILDPKSGEQFYDPCPACRDPETGESTGRVEGLAAALFRAAPIIKVRPSDREPGNRSGSRRAWWYTDPDWHRSGGRRHWLPVELRPHLTGSICEPIDEPRPGVCGFVYGDLMDETDGVELARADCSAACVKYSRDLIKLPALTPVPVTESKR